MHALSHHGAHGAANDLGVEAVHRALGRQQAPHVRDVLKLRLLVISGHSLAIYRLIQEPIIL